MARAFASKEDELTYLIQVKSELDGAATRQEMADIWKRHYLQVGHRKLGRLLLGQSPEQALHMAGGRDK